MIAFASMAVKQPSIKFKPKALADDQHIRFQYFIIAHYLLFPVHFMAKVQQIPPKVCP